MKIGEFSQEFQVPQHIIRYYIELGLLAPGVKNHQYSFNGDCRADIRLIEKLKAVGFLLKDIHKILSPGGLSNSASPEDSGKLAPYIEERLQGLEQEEEQWKRGKRRLEERIADLKSQTTRGRG